MTSTVPILRARNSDEWHRDEAIACAEVLLHNACVVGDDADPGLATGAGGMGTVNGIHVPEASDAYRFHTRPKEGRCRQVMADLFCTHRHGDQDWFEIGGPKSDPFFCLRSSPLTLLTPLARGQFESQAVQTQAPRSSCR